MVGDLCGGFRELDTRTSNWRELASMRIKIVGENLYKIPRVISAKVNNMNFPLIVATEVLNSTVGYEVKDDMVKD